METPILLVVVVPIVLLVPVVLRRFRKPVTELGRRVYELVTLRMVLRGARPEERAKLLAAHRRWQARGRSRRRSGRR